MTTWWIEPATALATKLPHPPEQMLAQLVSGLTATFRDRRVDLRVRGHEVSASLESLFLAPRPGRGDLTAELTDVEVDALAVDRLSVRARSVQMLPGRQATLAAEEVEVRGTARVQALVGWLDQRVAGWTLALDDQGRVVGRRRPGDPMLVADAQVLDGTLVLELRAVRWRTLQVRIPRWLRLERRLPVPLGDGWTIAEATRSGDRVRFRLLREGFREPVSAARLREAMLAGGTLRL